MKKFYQNNVYYGCFYDADIAEDVFAALDAKHAPVADSTLHFDGFHISSSLNSDFDEDAETGFIFVEEMTVCGDIEIESTLCECKLDPHAMVRREKESEAGMKAIEAIRSQLMKKLNKKQKKKLDFGWRSLVCSWDNDD